jgi:NodT family efflux transporter outer membrane factor (OMF) lipoprotein
MRTSLSLSGLLLGALVLTGCMVGPTYHPDPPATPAAFTGADPGAAMAPLSLPVSRSADLANWWHGFGDAELDRLVERALAANLDRQTAASRIRSARASAVETRAGLFPSLSAHASPTRTQISENAGLSSIGSTFSSGGSGNGGASPSGFPGLEFDTYDIGLTATWDLDLFGGRKRAVEAAQARIEAAVWSGRDTDVAVTSDVARAYFQLRADQARLAVVKAHADNAADLLQLITARNHGGLVTEVDIVQQRTEVASTRSLIAPLEAAVDSDLDQLAFLLDETTDVLTTQLTPAKDPAAALGRVPFEVPVGLPSDLLKRRPDVREAERQLAASVADVGQATAALYPSLSLTGSVDFLSTDLGTLLQAASRNYTIAAQLMQPLFDAGRLRARKHESEESAIQAGIAYRRTVLQALQQTADALASYAADQRRLLVLRSGYTDAQRAATLTRAQYLGGLQDLQGSLRAQAVALQVQDQLVQTQAQLDLDLITLYRALGGGWQDASTVARGAPVRASHSV